MNNIILNNEDLTLFYIQFFEETLHTGDCILYVGYEENDFLLPIIAQNKVNILAIDRKDRPNKIYDNVRYMQIDFADIRMAIGDVHFEWIIFSFILHENSPIMHKKFVDIAKSISNYIIIIEPIPRQDVVGMEYEQKLLDFYKKRNQFKCYYNIEYWQKIMNYDSDTDKCIILKRGKDSCEKLSLIIQGKKKLISFQDIAIYILCKK